MFIRLIGRLPILNCEDVILDSLVTIAHAAFIVARLDRSCAHGVERMLIDDSNGTPNRPGAQGVAG